MPTQLEINKAHKPHIYSYKGKWYCRRIHFGFFVPGAQLGVPRASPLEAYEASKRLYNW